MQVRQRAPLRAGILASALWIASCSVVAAEARIDLAIADGHFFTQAAADAPAGHGFGITDEDGVPFWSEFERLGGVDVLGYPISRRFYLDGFLCQATQRAILQWDPGARRVLLVNTMEYLTRLGADDHLAQKRFVPLPRAPRDDVHRDEWLAVDRRFRTIYEGARDPLVLFGLPQSPPVESGAAIAMRFQRAVIYLWKDVHPWTGPDRVSIANAGDLVKEARGIPEAALRPEAPPPARHAVDPSRGSPRDSGRIGGVATWYGAWFQGRPMANGDPYDMWDPGTAASNSHPLGSRLRVTRVATGESILVQVTDRGAFRMPIVVDLSYAAFASLADPDDGVIRVVVELLE